MSGLEEMSREELMVLARALLADNARLGELEAENAELRDRVARLERLISRNSGNSGMPPSADDLPGKPPPASKPARGAKRRPGKQPGAPGTALAWDDAVDPGNIVDHFPAGSCVCGAALADAADLGVTARHQQVEIPLVVAERRQHDLHTVACGCGRVHTAPRPQGVPAAPVSMGPNLQAWCVYLMVAHGSGSSRHSPRNRLVASVLNRASLGTLLFDLLTTDEEYDRDKVFDIGLLARRLIEATGRLRDRAAAGGLGLGYFGASTGGRRRAVGRRRPSRRDRRRRLPRRPPRPGRVPPGPRCPRLPCSSWAAVTTR